MAMAQEQDLSFECRSIRLGNYLIVHRPGNLQLPLITFQSFKEMLFHVPHCETGAGVDMIIPVSTIVSIQACFGKLNCLFIQTTPNHARWMRSYLGMGNEVPSEYFYCPLNGEGSHQKFITVNISRMLSHSEKAMLQQIYGNVLTEIKWEKANEMLVNFYKCTKDFTDTSPLNLSVKNFFSPTQVSLEHPEYKEKEYKQDMKTPQVVNSKYFTTPTRLKKQKPIKQVQVKNVMSSAFVDNLLNPSLINFDIIYKNGQAKIKFTHSNE